MKTNESTRTHPLIMTAPQPPYASNITELVGGTPLVQIPASPEGSLKDVLLLGKLEYCNPAGSVKDRIALAMIQDAEAQKLIEPGKTTIVEATSGNTGIGLALVAAAKGYKLILVMPESMSMERRVLLKAYGAELILTPAAKGMKGAVQKAQLLASTIKDSWIPAQFDNPANPAIHAATTAEEIWQDTQGTADMLIAGVGTGGSISGIGSALKAKKPQFQTVAVEPTESPVISGGSPAPHKIQGIGAGFIPSNLDRSVVDKCVTVASAEAIETARWMAKSQGLLIGISSGAALSAAFREAQSPDNKGKTIVVILPSNGERYLSSALFQQELAEVEALQAVELDI